MKPFKIVGMTVLASALMAGTNALRAQETNEPAPASQPAGEVEQLKRQLLRMQENPALGMLSDDENFNVVRVEVDYKSELRFPGDFEVGIRGLKYGRTSFRLGHGVFQGDRCCCTEEVVLVFMDRAARKPKPLSEKLLAWLKENGATPN